MRTMLNGLGVNTPRVLTQAHSAEPSRGYARTWVPSELMLGASTGRTSLLYRIGLGPSRFRNPLYTPHPHWPQGKKPRTSCARTCRVGWASAKRRGTLVMMRPGLRPASIMVMLSAAVCRAGMSGSMPCSAAVGELAGGWGRDRRDPGRATGSGPRRPSFSGVVSGVFVLLMAAGAVGACDEVR
jgi:hypothetical protein